MIKQNDIQGKLIGLDQKARKKKNDPPLCEEEKAGSEANSLVYISSLEVPLFKFAPRAVHRVRQH